MGACTIGQVFHDDNLFARVVDWPLWFSMISRTGLLVNMRTNRRKVVDLLLKRRIDRTMRFSGGSWRVSGLWTLKRLSSTALPIKHTGIRAMPLINVGTDVGRYMIPRLHGFDAVHRLSVFPWCQVSVF